MGLRYIEAIKTITLILLIGLSIVLTLLIWNSSPYETIVKRATVDISIAEEPEKKDVGSIIKPYQIVFNFEEGLKGTIDSEEIDHIVNTFKKWRISNPLLEDKNFEEDKLSDFMRGKNRFTLYFPDDVPLPVYDSMLNVENPNVPEIGFDLIVVEWDPANTTIDMNFISRKNKLRYKSTAKVFELQVFQREVLNFGRSFDEYADVNPEGKKFIAVPAKPVQLLENTYIQNEKDEISPTRFRSALFSDPNAVRRKEVSAHREDFQDNHALMSVDTQKKQLQYVHPVVESRQLAIPSELLEDTIDFINEHGGWTDDYRFSSMNFRTRYVKFKLYVRGLPVLGGNTLTEIEQVWGDETIYQYKRPYYTLGETLRSEMETVTLPSGIDIAEQLRSAEDIDFNMIEEIVPAYYMHQDVEWDIFVLKPSWYYLRNGKWIRFSSEQSGGEKIGLE